MLKTINNKLHTPTWLFVLLAVALLFRLPTFFEPYSYGDEMIYLALGEAIRQKIPLYAGIHDNKPPLLYVIAAAAGSLFWFRAILAIWHLATIYLFWKLASLLFPKNRRLIKVSTVVFTALTTLPLLEGNIANAELFMIGPTIFAFIILLGKKLSKEKLLLSGLLFSVATLFKVPAMFDIPAIIFLWIATEKLNLKSIIKISRRTILIAFGFLIPIALTFVWYMARGALSEYFIAAFGQNVGYLSTFRPGDVQEPFLSKNGPLLARAVLTGLSLLALFAFRKKLSKQYLFITAWLVMTLFAVTLSERPYPHYIIQSVPAISLMIGMLVSSKTIEQTLVIIPLAIYMIAPVYYRFWYYPTYPYYARFVKFATGQTTKYEYFGEYGGHILRNYKIADFIRSNTKENAKIFVWGDSSMVYALSRRLPPIKYVADYHIRDFSSGEEVLSGLETDMPELIIILPGSDKFGLLNKYLQANYRLTLTIDGAQIWKLLSPGVRALIAP